MTIPPTTLPTIDQRNADELMKILKRSQDTPNILTVEEFRRYAPLYQQANRTREAVEKNPGLAALAQEYQSRIDFYKPTHVIKSRTDTTVVLRLPRILVPLRTLSATPENEKAVNANYTYRKSDLPKIWSRAQNQMTAALLEEQASPEQVARIAEARKETQNILAEIDQVYGRPSKTAVVVDESNVTRGFTADAFEDL